MGPYEILGPLGAGGMGEVYRARDPRLGRDVAVKVLPEDLTRDPERVRRFEKEARAAGSLNHRNILDVHDTGIDEGVPYIVSELLEGETLRRRLGAAALPLRQVIDYAVQIADGLAAAHEKGIVHRDLKPENLFMTREGSVKILDFGLAKAMPVSPPGAESETATWEHHTHPGAVMGTVGYMSPEQVRGDAVDHRSDIFSFGAVLYEMLSGRRAFLGDSGVEVLNAILKEEPTDLSEARPDAPPTLTHTLQRCLGKRPQERFQSAGDLAFALKEVLEELGAAPATTRRWQARFLRPRRHAYLALGGLALAAALAGGTLLSRAWRTWQRAAPAQRIQSIAVLPIDNLSGDPEQEYFADGMTEELIARLSTIGAMRVISRRSVMRFKRSGAPVSEIARALKVEAVIEGSVRRAGSRVRITTQLVQVSPERQLWSRSYERDVTDILRLQDEVARAIAREIEVSLTPQERSRLSRARAIDPAAHEAYLRGRFHLGRLSPGDLKQALVYFQEAVEADPSYAAGYGGLAEAHLNVAAMGYSPPTPAVSKAEAAALRAVKLDDMDGRAHAALGRVRLWSYDWPGAEAGLKRAIELDPGDADAHKWYASYLGVAGRDAESLAEMRRSLELDPLSLMTNDAMAARLSGVGRLGEVIELSRKAIELDPDFVAAYYRLLHAYRDKGMYQESLEAAKTLLTLVTGDAEIGASMDRAHARSGYQGAMLAAARKLEELSKLRYVKPFFIAECLALAGRKDEALQWLGKSYEERDPWLIWLPAWPGFRVLYSDTRFQDIVRRMNFPKRESPGS